MTEGARDAEGATGIQRYVLFNPATQEPLTDPDGNWIHDPTYGDVAAVAMLFGALNPQTAQSSPSIGKVCEAQREGSRRHRRVLTT